MDDGGILVPIAFFAMIAAIIIVPQVMKSRERAKLHDTLRAAYEKGQPVPPELVEALTRKDAAVVITDRAARDFRLGIIWLFIGLGCIGIGAAFYGMLYNHGGAVETMMSFTAIGAVPACIGLAFLLLSYFGRGKVR